jgi:hypothetical protein
MLVDFFIIGVQKGGTSALDHFLRAHPQIRMANVKEIHFFDDESINWAKPEYTRLHDAFDWSQPDIKLRGEATPIYIYWPSALARLRDYNNAAKLIVCLRHPSFRAYSHWRMETKRGYETLDFSASIRHAGRQRVFATLNAAHRVFSYVERGFYAAQIDRLFSMFPRKQISFHRTDQLWKDVEGTLENIQDFLGVSRQLSARRAYISPIIHSPRAFCGISPEDLAYLNKLFADDISRTGEQTRLSLDDWLDPRYVEPMELAAG